MELVENDDIVIYPNWSGFIFGGLISARREDAYNSIHFCEPLQTFLLRSGDFPL